jgi:hypothetical protein
MVWWRKMSDENAQNGASGAPDLGGLQIPSVAGAESGSSVPGGSASEEVIRKRKQRSDAGKPRGARGGTTGSSVQALSQTQFAALYNPEVWAKALAAPADAMAAITGRKHWEVSEKEREALGATGSIAAQCFAVTDPRWLAVSLALITVLDVYGVRLAIDFAERKKKREAEEKQRGT